MHFFNLCYIFVVIGPAWVTGNLDTWSLHRMLRDPGLVFDLKGLSSCKQRNGKSINFLQLCITIFLAPFSVQLYSNFRIWNVSIFSIRLEILQRVLTIFWHQIRLFCHILLKFSLLPWKFIVASDTAHFAQSRHREKLCVIQIQNWVKLVKMVLPLIKMTHVQTILHLMYFFLLFF